MKNFTDAIKNDKFFIYIPIAAIVTRFLIHLFYPFTYEDAFITFRYAENLANGFGLVYNLGEHVYGTTAPLFAIILAAFKLIGIPCSVSSLTISLAAEGITSIIVYKLLKDYSNTFIAATIALLYVFSPSNISWSIQGMETALFGCVIALSFFFLYRSNYYLAFFFAFFSAIIRIDGLSVTFIVFVFILIEQKTLVVKYLLLPLTLFLGWLTFLYFYFGSFLPNSMIAKLILYSGHQESILPNLKLVFSKFFISGYYSSLVVTLFFFGGIFLIIKNNLRLFPIIVWFFIYYFALIFSKTSIHGWYLIPPLFVYITISGIGIIYILNLFQRKFPAKKALLHVIVLFSVLFFSSLTLFIKINQISSEYQYEKNVRIKVGEFLRDNTPKNSTIYLEPIGIIGYYSERYIYDDAALISPIFLELNRLPLNSKNRYKKIQLVNPDYVVLRNKYLKEFYSTTNLTKNYTLVKSFENFADRDDPDFANLTIFKKI